MNTQIYDKKNSVKIIKNDLTLMDALFEDISKQQMPCDEFGIQFS